MDLFVLSWVELSWVELSWVKLNLYWIRAIEFLLESRFDDVSICMKIKKYLHLRSAWGEEEAEILV